MTAAFEARTREQRNALLTYKTWRIARRDWSGRALMVPLDERGADVRSGRVWVEADQIQAGGLATRLRDGPGG